MKKKLLLKFFKEFQKIKRVFYMLLFLFTLHNKEHSTSQ